MSSTSEVEVAGASGLTPRRLCWPAEFSGGPIADYNGEGKCGILWQNSTGVVAVWEMNGTTVISAASRAGPGLIRHA